jgi:cation/acetate symporter
MMLNFAVAQTLSRFTAPPPADVQEIVEHIRIPRELRQLKKH